MTEYRASAQQIEEFTLRALCAVNVPMKDARTVASLIAEADLIGVDSHGILRLPLYIARILAGGINVSPSIKVDRQTAATALVDGDNGMGHLVAKFATDLAIEKAMAAGIGWVGTFNSNHAGPAGLYTRMPLEHNMVAIYGAVGSANHMPAWGGREPLLSTNPISIATPSASGSPIVLDMATTVASMGKVHVAEERGESIPEGWIIGRDGKPITDPRRAREGLLVPVGGAKGYGLSLMLGLLAGTLNSAAMGSDVVDFTVDLGTPANTGQFICVISLVAFGDAEEIGKRFGHVAEEMRSSQTMPGFDKVRVPGDESYRKQQDNVSSGISIPGPLVEKLNNLASDLEIKSIVFLS